MAGQAIPRRPISPWPRRVVFALAALAFAGLLTAAAGLIPFTPSLGVGAAAALLLTTITACAQDGGAAGPTDPLVEDEVKDSEGDFGREREDELRVKLGASRLEESFAVHYQPIVDARTGEYASAEALLRAPAPDMADVSPQMLVALAEEDDRIFHLTDWTLDQALAAIRTLDAPVAVNLSPRYFRHPDFVQRVFDRLLSARVRPDLLTLEVTEGVLVADVAGARNSLGRLREVGVKLVLDDFGTGFSSLSYLQHFELDGLKLDKSFLHDIGDRSRTTQIIRSMIDFGHSLDMRVAMEGVESDWQARMLQLLGCDLLQGFEIGVPMPLDELLDYRRTARSPGAERLAAGER